MVRWKILDMELFTIAEFNGDPVRWVFKFMVALVGFVAGMIVALPTSGIISGLTTMGFNPVMDILFFPLGLLFAAFMVFGEYLYEFRGMNDSSKELANRYAALPKEDKQFFPKEIINTLKNPNLSWRDRTRIEDGVVKIFNEINKRDMVRKELASRNLDTTAVEDALEHGYEMVKIATDTYKELA